MKQLFVSIIAILTLIIAKAQSNSPDTNYATRIVSAEWMPDGKAVLLAVVKFHKTNRQAPFFSKVFRYDLAANKAEVLFEDGSNVAPSPDGKTIAFMKRSDPKRTDIYFYNIEIKQETVFKTDTIRKNSLSWSPDGKNLLYNINYNGSGAAATVDICVLNIATKEIKQVTQSGKDKSYDPNWCPDSKKIVYYLEKGDGHDQIWLTDVNGSFHRNLTNDTTTHNYFPSWLDERTIIYTQSPGSLMMMNADGTNRRKIMDIDADQAKYNAVAKKFVYLTSESDNKVFLFDRDNKISTVILDGTKMIAFF